MNSVAQQLAARQAADRAQPSKSPALESLHSRTERKDPELYINSRHIFRHTQTGLTYTFTLDSINYMRGKKEHVASFNWRFPNKPDIFGALAGMSRPCAYLRKLGFIYQYPENEAPKES